MTKLDFFLSKVGDMFETKIDFDDETVDIHLMTAKLHSLLLP